MTRFDILLMSLLCIGVAGFLFFTGAGRTTGTNAILSINGENTAVIDLTENKIIKAGKGESKVKIEVKDGRVRIIDSSCKKQLCKHAGWIKNTGEAVICVPGKVVLEIKAGKEKGFDAICR